MKRNRLEAVLTRNRKHLVLDVALAAFFLMALLFSGLAFGSGVQKLTVASRPARAQVTQVAQIGDSTAGAIEADAPAVADLGHR